MQASCQLTLVHLASFSTHASGHVELSTTSHVARGATSLVTSVVGLFIVFSLIVLGMDYCKAIRSNRNPACR